MEKKGIKAILQNFSIGKKAYTAKPINQGFINDTYLVLDKAAPQFILQQINTGVFPNIQGLMSNVEKALDYLHDKDYTPITLVKTLGGASYFETSSSTCWRLMTYIAKSTAYDTTTEKKVAFEAGRIIGKFHELLQNAPVEDFVETIPQFHDLGLRENQFNAALKNTSSGLRERAEKAIIFTKEIVPKLKEWEQGDVPVRVCHNDTKLNNILFSKDTGKALCLIDLDTLMKGYFHYDFGDAVRTIVNTAPEDEKLHDKITFDRGLFEAFVDGLRMSEVSLTQKEKELLPFGAVLLPFLHGIRALTDFLNGNIYYKVAYENQNLDRCLSLFDFTNKALNEAHYMVKIINQKMG